MSRESISGSGINVTRRQQLKQERSKARKMFFNFSHQDEKWGDLETFQKFPNKDRSKNLLHSVGKALDSDKPMGFEKEEVTKLKLRSLNLQISELETKAQELTMEMVACWLTSLISAGIHYVLVRYSKRRQRQAYKLQKFLRKLGIIPLSDKQVPNLLLVNVG